MTSPEHTLAHLGLGCAYVLQCDSRKARAAYQDFFALWKEAEAEIPIQEAKAEYAKLKQPVGVLVFLPSLQKKPPNPPFASHRVFRTQSRRQLTK